jgi:Ca-activated chloride channel family protein
MATTIEIRPGYAQIPVGSAAVNYGAITIHPDLAIQQRATVQIGLVIDTSGSMDGQIHGRFSQKKIDLVRDAAQRVINQLNDGDYVTVVAFSDRVQVLAFGQQVTADRSKLLRAVGNLRANGGTLMGDGIAAALKELRNLPNSGAAVRKIVVLTDGQTNDEDYCYQLAEQTEIPFMLGGIGDDYNGTLLNEMARSARGMAEYIDRAEMVQDFFGEVMATVQATVITNATLTLEFRQRFRPLRVHEVAPELKSFDFAPVTPTSRRTSIALGDIQKDGLTLLVQYAYEGGAGFANEFQVASLDLTYDMPPQAGLQVHSDDFTVLLGDQPGFPALDPVVKSYVDHAEVETAQTRVLQAAQAGDAAAATQRLDNLQQSLERIGADQGFIQQTVQTMKLTLQNTGDASQIADSSATKKLTSGTRKLSLPQQDQQ